MSLLEAVSGTQAFFSLHLLQTGCFTCLLRGKKEKNETQMTKASCIPAELFFHIRDVIVLWKHHPVESCLYLSPCGRIGSIGHLQQKESLGR